MLTDELCLRLKQTCAPLSELTGMSTGVGLGSTRILVEALSALCGSVVTYMTIMLRCWPSAALWSRSAGLVLDWTVR